MVLEFKNIYKSFEDKTVLIDSSFKAHSGSPLGLLGRNGAGKTTFIRILIGIFFADKGQILVDGKPIEREKIKFGYLPEERGLYPKKNIMSQLIYIGMLKGLSKFQAINQSKSLLKRIKLENYSDKKLETLSKGNAQKIQLITALLGDPQIIVLDEPFSGLDPLNAQLLKDIVYEESKKNKIVLFSSHQMSYVEEFCEHIAILNEGKIVLKGNLSDIKNKYPKNQIKISPYTNKFLDFLNKSDKIDSCSVSNNSIIATLKSENSKDIILKESVEHSFSIDTFELLKPSLEQIFIDKVGS